jgi:putative Mn2+ efflux pump MntP
MPEFIIEMLILVTALSIDAFVASMAYGMQKIRIPAFSVLIIAFISSTALALSMLAGHLICRLLPVHFTAYLSFTVLLILGIIKLLNRSCSREADKANKNNDNLLSPAEALYLGIALSLDGLAAGIGAGVSPVWIFAYIGCSFFISIIAIVAGSLLGSILLSQSNKNLCWIGGVLLIFLAFMKLLK